MPSNFQVLIIAKSVFNKDKILIRVKKALDCEISLKFYIKVSTKIIDTV